MINEPEGRLEFRRTFPWGVLLIGDPETTDIPELGRQGVVASNLAAVVVRVRHAQDVEFAGGDDEEIPPFVVSVSCSPGVSQGRELSCDGVISLESGMMSLGDADQEEILTLSPGTYRLRIGVDPGDHPEPVCVW